MLTDTDYIEFSLCLILNKDSILKLDSHDSVFVMPVTSTEMNIK